MCLYLLWSGFSVGLCRAKITELRYSSLYRSLPSSLHVLRPLAIAFRLFFCTRHVLTTYFRGEFLGRSAPWRATRYAAFCIARLLARFARYAAFCIARLLARFARYAAFCIARFLARSLFSGPSLLRSSLPSDLSACPQTSCYRVQACSQTSRLLPPPLAHREPHERRGKTVRKLDHRYCQYCRRIMLLHRACTYT